MLRLCGAELVEVPALPYSNPEQLPACRHGGSPIELRKSEPNGVLFADQWNNLDNARRITNRPARKSGSRPAARSTASSARSAPAARWPASAGYLKREEQGHRRSPCADPPGAAMYELFTHGEAKATPGGSITEGIGLGRVTPVDRDRQGRRRLSDSRRGSRADHLTTCSSTKACASAARPASTSPARSGSPSSSGPARPSSPSSPIPATAISQNCSIRSSCARRNLPCAGHGWRSAPRSRCRSRRCEREL